MKDKILNSKKIAIFGWPATGKSTLGEYLSKKMNVKMYSLDLIRWNNSKDGIKDDDAFINEYNNILKNNEWIIEGNALDWIDSRLNQADILIFFDSDVETTIANFLQREEKLKRSEELRKSFDANNNQPVEKTIDWIKNRFSKKIVELRKKLEDYQEKLIIINNYEELTKLINELNKE